MRDARSGQLTITDLDNPLEQRQIVNDGAQPLANEFWLVEGAWPVEPRSVKE